MSLENFAAGNAMFPQLPYYEGAGIVTPYGMLTPPGSRVAAWVRSTGVQDLDPQPMGKELIADLATALKRVRSGYGDIIFLLPGHTETITDNTQLTNLVAGTKIIGLGMGSNQAKIRWGNTAAQWVLNKNDVLIQNLRLEMSGANGVVKAVNITGSGVRLIGNDIIVAEGAALKSTIAIEVGTGADQCRIIGNYLRGTETHNVTDCVKVVAAVNDFVFANNVALLSATAGNGVVHITAAALRFLIERNSMYNTHTSSTACIAVDDVAADGVIHSNMMGVKNNGTAASQGVTFGTAAICVAFNNYCSDEPKKSGALAPGAAT
jgi:hypothetical protein